MSFDYKVVLWVLSELNDTQHCRTSRGLYLGFLKNNGSLPCKSEARKVGRNPGVLQEKN